MTSEQISISLFIPSASGETNNKVAVNLVGVLYYSDRRMVEVGLKSSDDKVHAFIDGNVENMEQLALEIIKVIQDGQNDDADSRGLTGSKD
ncbi:MAG: hypothetical protein NTW99_03750 [Chloroflexi bacterium]|nr:hypothetical protein [Chloroflexota bacterium]